MEEGSTDGKKQRNLMCFLLNSLLSKACLQYIQPQMVIEILDSSAFWRQWNTVKRLLRGKKALKTIISNLKFSRIKEKIPPLKWLRKMDHRKAIANTSQRPVSFLSMEEYLSLIPNCKIRKFKTGSHLLNACQWKSLGLGALEGN
ncbi:uncharacterized protein VP01_5261g1 [Puccinia sorghi]|uniref:Uncharacterized protein n=1 Tax=Puccinia sorghi TaxID=27349 RepID=A0A0L6UKG1_9BASI|nr:uncharacterized protein VP01_5261g1 [Puccinia sorghi]